MVMRDDDELTREEAEAVLADWLGRPVSLIRADRRVGLPHTMQGRNIYFRYGDLRRWVQEHRFGRGKRDLRGTALGDWLHARDKTIWGFARELEIPETAIAALLRRDRSKARRLPLGDVLQLISLETDIPMETLIADALHALPKAAE